MTKIFQSDTTLLTCAEMAAADQYTVAQGIPAITLMERAGRGIADVAERFWRDAGAQGSILVVCGPGDNGGDGYVAARRLVMSSITVRVAQFGDLDKIKGTAALAIEKCPCALETLEGLSLAGVSLVIDALFGAGFSKPVTGLAASFINKINMSDIPVISVDMPSGLYGDKGRADDSCIRANETVTFHAKKPGHLLYPGRRLCGKLHVVDIGIDRGCYDKLKPLTFENLPPLWRDMLPVERVDQHKYHRGHVIVLGSKAPALGASRLTALAALRTGSGLVTLMAPSETYEIQAGALDDVMVVNMAGRNSFLQRLKDIRITAVAMGPGAGVGLETKKLVLKTLESEHATVLDADALSSFVEEPNVLFAAIKGPTVITPHTGEFNKLFPDLDYGEDKLAVARTAAKRSGAVLILKGPDTVIASPCGRAAINTNAPTHLSVGGTGDVLTGMVAALLGRGMPAFESACAAVWLHAKAAESYSLGMIASDLLIKIPSGLSEVTKMGTKTL